MKRCCNCFQCDLLKDPRVCFHNQPLVKSWTLNDGEVTLFDVWVKLTASKQLLVDVNITAEISPSAPEVYNVYKLYVDEMPVTQTGYEADDESAGPNLESSSISYGKSFAHHECCKCVRVQVTAQIKGPAGGPVFASNVNNQVGNFKGAKVASLRTLTV